MTRCRPTGISPKRSAPSRCAPATPRRRLQRRRDGRPRRHLRRGAVAPRSTKPSPKANSGDGSLFELFAHGFVDDFDLGPNFAVNCLDLPHPTTSADVEALAAQAADAATVLPELSGAYVRAFALPCLHWPVPAPAALEPVTAAGAPPILVVGNTGDPVTPFESAQHVAATLRTGISSPTPASATPPTARTAAPTLTSTRTCSTSRSLSRLLAARDRRTPGTRTPGPVRRATRHKRANQARSLGPGLTCSLVGR